MGLFLSKAFRGNKRTQEKADMWGKEQAIPEVSETESGVDVALPDDSASFQHV